MLNFHVKSNSLQELKLSPLLETKMLAGQDNKLNLLDNGMLYLHMVLNRTTTVVGDNKIITMVVAIMEAGANQAIQTMDGDNKTTITTVVGDSQLIQMTDGDRLTTLTEAH